MKKSLSLVLWGMLIIIGAPAQSQQSDIERRQQDFEEFRRERQEDFENFVRQREEELARMEQAYQDYYNELHGLRRHYQEIEDEEKEAVVNDLIEFEDHISQATGKTIEVTEAVRVEIETKTKDIPEVPDTEEPETIPQETTEPSQRETPTTFIPLPEEGTSVPILAPLSEENARVTSPYGMRHHPILNISRMHNGMDFGSGNNTEIYAAANGEVILAQYSRSFGNWIILKHENGYNSVYAHLNEIKVSVGAVVNIGEIIGLTGSTGRSTAPHLHYEVRLDGTPVDPEGYLVSYQE